MAVADPPHLSGRAGRHRLEPDRHRRASQHRRYLPFQLVHDRRCAVDLHHRVGGDPAVVPVRPRPGICVRLLHAQRRRHVVYAARPRHLLLRATETPQSPDLFLRARRVRVLDQPGVLPDHRRASLPVQPAAMVAADHGDRVQRRHAGAGLGWQCEFPPDDARARARSRAFVSADVHSSRRDRLSRRVDAGHRRSVSLVAGSLASDQLHGRPLAPDDVRVRHVRDLGRRLCTTAIRYRQRAGPVGADAPLLDGRRR